MPTTKNSYYYGLGRRKTSSARVRVLAGSGNLIINGKTLTKFPETIKEPFKLLGLLDKYDTSANVSGGGKLAQLDAVRLGVARALLTLNPDFRKTLKLAGLLTRDPRAKERKKPGLKGARKAPQWSKR